jgi:hypothetical protein
VVVTSATLSGPAVLILFPEVLVTCNAGKTKIKVKAPVLFKLTRVSAGTDIREYGLIANCTAHGKQELKESANDEGKLVKGILSANFGLGFETACERNSEELLMHFASMIDFLF